MKTRHFILLAVLMLTLAFAIGYHKTEPTSSACDATWTDNAGHHHNGSPYDHGAESEPPLPIADPTAPDLSQAGVIFIIIAPVDDDAPRDMAPFDSHVVPQPLPRLPDPDAAPEKPST